MEMELNKLICFPIICCIVVWALRVVCYIDLDSVAIVRDGHWRREVCPKESDIFEGAILRAREVDGRLPCAIAAERVRGWVEAAPEDGTGVPLVGEFFRGIRWIAEIDFIIPSRNNTEKCYD